MPKKRKRKRTALFQRLWDSMKERASLGGPQGQERTVKEATGEPRPDAARK